MLRIVILLVFALMAAGIPCFAQEHHVNLNIPFAFTFEGLSLPAGTYIMDVPGRTAVLVEVDQGKGVVVSTRDLRPSNEPGDWGHFHFIQSEGKYYLHLVEVGPHQAHLRLPKAIDQMLAKNHSGVRTITIVGD